MIASAHRPHSSDVKPKNCGELLCPDSWLEFSAEISLGGGDSLWPPVGCVGTDCDDDSGDQLVEFSSSHNSAISPSHSVRRGCDKDGGV